MIGSTQPAKVMFYLDDDDDIEPHESAVIEANGQLWFVANWIVALATGERIPAQLIPMARLHHSVRADGLYQLATTIPSALGFYPVPPELRREYMVVDNPALSHIPGPQSIH